MLVIDASAAVDIVVRSPRSAALRQLTDDERLFTPHLFYSEALSGISRLERSGSISPAYADQAVAWLNRLPIRTVWSADWVSAAWAKRSWLRTTDALYVVAAERLGAPLLTTDQRLGRVMADRSIDVIAL